MSPEAAYRSPCPLSSALDVVGDRWSLVVIRSLFTGARRYRDFLDFPEAISTNILADRLKRLERQGLIVRGPDPSAPNATAYSLTRMGADLLPAMQALAAWGHANIAGRWTPPEWFMAARPEDYYPSSDDTRG